MAGYVMRITRGLKQILAEHCMKIQLHLTKRFPLTPKVFYSPELKWTISRQIWKSGIKGWATVYTCCTNSKPHMDNRTRTEQSLLSAAIERSFVTLRRAVSVECNFLKRDSKLSRLSCFSSSTFLTCDQTAFPDLCLKTQFLDVPCKPNVLIRKLKVKDLIT